MPTTSRRQWLLHSLAGAAAAVAGPRAARAERMRVRMAVGGKAGFYYLPLTLAEQLGYFSAEGLEVAITDFPGGSHALRAALDGTADVVSGAYEHTIELQSRGLRHQAFVLQGRAPQIALGVSPRFTPSLRTVSDLRGRRIGVSAPGSSTNMVANFALARAGVRPSEVRFVGVGTGEGALRAFRLGEVDAMCNIDPLMTVLETRGEIRILSDTRTHQGAVDLFGGPMPAACLYAPTDYVERQPEVCQALANAIVRALKWLQTAGPSDIIKAVPESYMLGDRNLYLASFNRVRDAMALDGLMPEGGPATALRALASINERVSSGRIDLDKTYTNEFARKAKQKFRA